MDVRQADVLPVAAPPADVLPVAAPSADVLPVHVRSADARSIHAPGLDRPAVDRDALERWIDRIAAEAPDQDDPYSVIDRCMADEMRTVGAPAASIAIAENGTITYVKGYGVRHRQNGGSVDAATMFRIGSSTKMMTAAAMMTLVDAGKIDLHAPITTYLPDLQLPAPWDASKITVHHLLSHSSGMSESYRLHSVSLLNSVSLATWAESYLPRTAMSAPPGTFWNYSNPGYSLVGYLIERLTGETHADYTRRRVWEPAGMPLTTFAAEDVIAGGNFAWGYAGGQAISPDLYPMPALAPAGMAFSTPSEMVAWALTLMQGGAGVMTPESAAAMLTPYVPTDWSPWERYGYGIFISEYRDRSDPSETVTVYEHGGNTTGWGSQLYWVPQRGVAVAILDSTMASLSSSAHCALRELAGIVPRPATGPTTAPMSWDAFAGTYAEMNQAQWDATIRVARDGNHMLVHRVEDDRVVSLWNVFGSSFKEDVDRNGVPDPAASSRVYTFSGDRAGAGPIRWLRNRIQVAERVGEFPPAVDMAGSSCRQVEFASAIDIPRLRVRAAGLVSPGRELRQGIPIAQDDPADPSTAGYKHSLAIRGEAGMFNVTLTPQPGDVLELYLLFDRDGDGRFAYPGEVVDVGWEGQGYRAMTVTGRPPSGAYQIWVHGMSVRGANRTFALETRLVDGEQLRIVSAPESARAGGAYSATVCAQGVEALGGPMAGLVEFDYGSPPRRIRIPVNWTPGVEYTVRLPAVFNRLD